MQRIKYRLYAMGQLGALGRYLVQHEGGIHDELEADIIVELDDDVDDDDMWAVLKAAISQARKQKLVFRFTEKFPISEMVDEVFDGSSIEVIRPKLVPKKPPKRKRKQ